MSDQTMETNVEEVEVMLTYTYRTDGEVSCIGSGSNAQEAREAAFRHARQQVFEWRQKAAELERQLEEARRTGAEVVTPPPTSIEPDLEEVRVSPFDTTGLVLPIHTAVIGLQQTGRTSIVADMIHSFGNRFSAVNVFTSRTEGAVSLQARTRMNASVLPFSFDLLESTMKFYYPANTAIVIESDVFRTLEFKSTDKASTLLQKAASYNVSLFCITSQLSSIPWRFELISASLLLLVDTALPRTRTCTGTGLDHCLQTLVNSPPSLSTLPRRRGRV
jgi:hypothetical protein